MNHKLMMITLAPILLGYSAPAYAGQFQSLTNMDSNIANFLRSQPGYSGQTAKPVDQRLKLATCPEQPQIELQNNIVSVSCKPLNWRIYVGLNTRFQDSSNEPIITRGQPVLLSINRTNFTVSQNMIADKAGKIGDIIAVRQNRSTQPIMVQITGPGTVSLP